MWSCPKCGERLEDQFDSCWRCAFPAASPSMRSVPSLRWFNYVLAALAAYLAPLTAVYANLGLILMRGGHDLEHLAGGSFYNVSIHTNDPKWWLTLLIPAGITFLAFLPFLKFDFARRFVFACACAVWAYVMYI